MQAVHINCFIKSLNRVFLTMLGCEVRRGTPYLKGHGVSEQHVSGVIGLSGEAAGAVVLSLSEEVAIRAASVMLGYQLDEVGADVCDAVGELTNMVAGAAKAELEEHRLLAGLPNVVTGKGHTITFPSNIIPICVPFETDWGPLSLEVGLTDFAARVTANGGK